MISCDERTEMKIAVAIPLAVVTAAMLGACSASSTEPAASAESSLTIAEPWNISDGDPSSTRYCILMDKETGVEYILTDGINGTSITPRVDHNGEPYIDDEALSKLSPGKLDEILAERKKEEEGSGSVLGSLADELSKLASPLLGSDAVDSTGSNTNADGNRNQSDAQGKGSTADGTGSNINSVIGNIDIDSGSRIGPTGDARGRNLVTGIRSL